MNGKVTRRGFLGGVAIFGSAALLPSTATAFEKGAEEASQSTGKDTEVQSLTGSPVGKIKWQAEPFSMPEVRLLPSFFRDMMEVNRSWLYSLPNDRLAHMFRLTAGIPSTAEPFGGWEAPEVEFRGHFSGGHYLSAAALMYACDHDESLRQKADELVDMLAACQQPDGYLSAFPTELFDRLRNHKEVLVPFYTYHKIMAGHLDMYLHCGNRQALKTVEGMARWAYAWVTPLSDAEFQRILQVEYGGMQEVLFNLYAVTGKKEYAELAARFSDHSFFDPLAAGHDDLPDLHANSKRSVWAVVMRECQSYVST
jgi:DUF1680 family protein